MKKFLAILLAMSILLTILAACNNTPIETPNEPDTPEVIDPVEPNVPDEPEVVEPVIPEYSETEVGAENTLTNAGTTITLNVSENKLYITNVATTASNVNMLVENSEFALPKCYQTEFPSKETFDLNWVFTSAVKFENKEVNDSMTSGLIYNFEDSEQKIKCRVYCVVRDDLSGPFEFYTEVENCNDSAFRIAPFDFASFTVDVIDETTTDYIKINREGWVAGGFTINSGDGNRNSVEGFNRINLSKIKRWATAYATTDDGNKDDFPAIYVDRNGKDGLFIALEWTHGAVKFVNNHNNTATTTVNLDVSDEKPKFFTTEISAGDTLLLPSVYLMPYDGSLDDGSNIYKNWFFECKTIPTLRDNPNEPLTQIDPQMYPPVAAEYGIESIKWDYGWWTTHQFTEPHSLEGSWVLRNPDFMWWLNEAGVSTMAEYGEYMDSYGLNWAMYVLLHDSVDLNNNVTDQYGEFNSITHPEWFSSETSGSDSKLADLGNVECVNYIKTTLTDLFSTNHIDTWRTDFQPIVSVSEHENRHDANGTDVSYWATKGFFEIIDHLYDSVEGFRYECCSMGGRQKDLYTATKAVVINVEDSSRYLNMRAAFYDSSYILHPAQLQIPCNLNTFDPNSEQYYFPEIAAPEVANGETYDFYDSMMNMGFRSTIIGVPHWAPWEGVPYWDYYREYIAMYKEKIRPLMRKAELYHILPRPDGTNWDGIMYADPDSANEIKGVVFLFKPSADVENVKNIVFDGLDENTVYQLTFEDRPEQNCTATGADLMTKGIDVEIKYVGSEIIWITKAE